MDRLKHDRRYRLEFDYRGDFVPCPVRVTVLDDSVSLPEIAQAIYGVAQHPVKHHGEYMAGTAEDADLHRPR